MTDVLLGVFNNTVAFVTDDMQLIAKKMSSTELVV